MNIAPVYFSKLILLVTVLASLSVPCRAEQSSTPTTPDPSPRYYGFLTPKQFFWGGIGAIVVAGALDNPIHKDVFYYRNSDPSVHLRRYGDVGERSGLFLGAAFGAQGILFRNAKSRQTSVLLLQSFVVSGLTASGIKYVVGRERPNATHYSGELGRHQLDSSFPSGHTTVAFSAATVIAEQYPKWYVAIPAYSAATGVGISRMYASKHWASDVVAGAMLGTAVSHGLRTHLLKKAAKSSAWHVVPTLDSIRLVREF